MRNKHVDFLLELILDMGSIPINSTFCCVFEVILWEIFAFSSDGRMRILVENNRGVDQR